MIEEAQITDEPAGEFPALSGMRYLRFLKRLHGILKPEWYLEIGTHAGASLELATCNSIAVDPDFKVRKEIVGTKPALHCLAMTSDDFFASGITEALGARFDLTFLDGMHRFEYLLRDFMGAERRASDDGSIVIHDCVPVSYIGAERDWDKDATRAWTGDVWKIVPILRRYRPDLDIRTVDCPPSGLMIVTELDPDNTVLADAYDEILDEFMDLELTPAMLTALKADMALGPAQAFLDTRGGDAKPAACDIAIKIPAPREETARRWGEFYFAQSLSEAFARAGFSARVDCLEAWDTSRHEGEFELVLRGRHRLEKGANAHAAWVLSHAESLAAEEYTEAAKVFVASELEAGTLATPLLHCTDPERFYPRDPVANCAEELLFVGACYPQRRDSGAVAWAMQAGLPVSVIGAGWGWLPEDRWIRRHIRNSKLGDFYASAGVVLNDHRADMRASGFVNNRIFDVLACGMPLVSDRVAGLPEGFEEFIYFADGPETLRAAVAQARAEDAVMARRRKSFAEHVRRHHSFDARAEIITRALELRPNPDNVTERIQNG